MFTRTFLLSALALAGAEAFAPGGAMIRPASARTGLSVCPLSMQAKDNASGKSDGPQPVASGGTQAVTPNNMPLFSYHSNLPEGKHSALKPKPYTPNLQTLNPPP